MKLPAITDNILDAWSARREVKALMHTLNYSGKEPRGTLHILENSESCVLTLNAKLHISIPYSRRPWLQEIYFVLAIPEQMRARITKVYATFEFYKYARELFPNARIL